MLSLRKAIIVLTGALASTTAQTTNSSMVPMYPLSADSQFSFYMSEVMALAYNGGSASGEVLRIASQLIPGDFESVCNSFYYMAERIHGQAVSVNATKDPISACEAYFRAASYYRGADFFLHGNWSDPRINSLWDQALNDFNHAIALLDIPGERLNVKVMNSSVGPYEVPMVFYKAAPCDVKRPTVIVINGYDGSQEESYHEVGVEILKRGYNFVTLEVPGQPTPRRTQNIGFIPDDWTALTPVVDYLATRPDVDMDRLALEGISFGATIAPRAAALEHRIKALVLTDGLYSILEAIEAQIPSELVELYNANSSTLFDEYLLDAANDKSTVTEFRWLIDQGLWAFNTHSPFQWFKKLGEVILSPDVVSCLKNVPVFVGKGADDTLTLQEPEKAYKLLVNGRPHGKQLTTFHIFNTTLGAGEHCQLGAEAQLGQVTMTWLDNVFEKMTGVPGTLSSKF